jgi:predicted PurR-regulated permease PerM
MNDLQRLLPIASVILLALLVYSLQPILSPFLVGALLAYLGDPAADRLEAWGCNRTVSVCIVFFGFTLVLVISLLVTLPLIGRQVDILIQKLPQWLDTVQRDLLPWIESRLAIDIAHFDLNDLRQLITQHWQAAGGIVAGVWQQVAGSSMAMLAAVANIVLIPVVAFYLLRDWDLMMANVRDSLPRSWEPKVVVVACECDEILGAFIRGQLLVMLALGIIYSLGLMVVGLELALLLGLLAGLASVVPYLGFIVGITAASVAAYFQFYEWLPLLWVAAVFGIGQALESMVLTPLLVGDRIGLHPVAVIFAIMAGGQLAGFVGVLLALPVAAVIMVWLRHLHRSYKESGLYGASKPAP